MLIADDTNEMSEEIENAAKNVPRAISSIMILNGATGLAMVLGVLFCLGDIDSVIVSRLHLPAFMHKTDHFDRIRLQGSPSFKSLLMGQSLRLELQ